jgi:hypothetical protein
MLRRIVVKKHHKNDDFCLVKKYLKQNRGQMKKD